MNEQAFLKLKEAFQQAEETSVRGKTIHETPSIVKFALKGSLVNRILGAPIIQGSPRWKPSINTPRVEFLISASNFTESFCPSISYSTLDFPDSCCKCMGPATHFELVELCSKDVSGKTRIWYAIPFCKEHDLESKAITFDITGSANKEKVVIHFTNKEYGRLFGSRNYIDGSWLTPTAMKARVLAPVGIFSGMVMIFFGLGGLYDNLVGFGPRVEKGLGPVTTLPVSILLLIVGLVLTVWLTPFWIKNRKGIRL